MPEDESKVDLKELAARMEQMEEAMDRLSRPYGQLVGYLDRLQEISRSYFRLLDLLQRFGSLSPDLAIPEVKDPISREIVRALFEKGERNISQLTDALRKQRGTASRRIVRGRLKILEEKGVVVSRKAGRGKVYDVSADAVRRWSEVLGLVAPAEGEAEKE